MAGAVAKALRRLLREKGLKPIALSEYTTDPQTTQALLSRAVEAQITDAAVARGVIDKRRSGDDLFRNLNLSGAQWLWGEKGNSEVKTALEEGLKKYSATPEYAALLKNITSRRRRRRTCKP